MVGMHDPQGSMRIPRRANTGTMRKNGSRHNGYEVEPHQVAPYGCPFCSQLMYSNQILDFGTVQQPDGTRAPSKYHRECKETNA